MKNIVYVYGSLIFLLVLVIGVSLASFVDTATLVGATFSVGSADIKLLDTIGGGVDETNLVDEKPGPTFTNIHPDWSEEYLVQIYNNATGDVLLTSNAEYDTANDPDDLRQIIFVEPFPWDDANANGAVDMGELGDSFGRKTIVKWKTEGYGFGTLNPGEVMGLALRISADAIPSSKQGKSAVFDFEFDALGL